MGGGDHAHPALPPRHAGAGWRIGRGPGLPHRGEPQLENRALNMVVGDVGLVKRGLNPRLSQRLTIGLTQGQHKVARRYSVV